MSIIGIAFTGSVVLILLNVIQTHKSLLGERIALVFADSTTTVMPDALIVLQITFAPLV